MSQFFLISGKMCIKKYALPNNYMFVTPQIRDLHIAKRTEDIGFYAGFVG